MVFALRFFFAPLRLCGRQKAFFRKVRKDAEKSKTKQLPRNPLQKNSYRSRIALNRQ